MRKDEILEYPYYGTITRIIAGEGREPDQEIVVYDGVMDEHMTDDEEGHVLQTASYIISIPLTKSENDEWIVPHKGDRISLTRYGEVIEFVTDNAEPSQIGGISIYAARNNW